MFLTMKSALTLAKKLILSVISTNLKPKLTH